MVKLSLGFVFSNGKFFIVVKKKIYEICHFNHFQVYSALALNTLTLV